MPPPRRALVTSLLRLRSFSSIAYPHPYPPAPLRRHQFVADPTTSTNRGVVGGIGGVGSGNGNLLDPTQLLRDDPVAITASLWVSSFRAAASTSGSCTPTPPQPLTPFLSRLELWVLAYQKAYADETGSYLPRSSIPASTLASLLTLRNAITPYSTPCWDWTLVSTSIL